GFGGPEKLVVHELPIPEITAQEVLIAVDTAGVGMWDIRIRQGEWADSKDFPMILGVDGSGIVAEAGSKVRHLARGDRVYAYSYGSPNGGFYAEYARVAATKVARIPEGLEMLPAGGMPAIALTALQGVDDTLKIKAG